MHVEWRSVYIFHGCVCMSFVLCFFLHGLFNHIPMVGGGGMATGKMISDQLRSMEIDEEVFFSNSYCYCCSYYFYRVWSSIDGNQNLLLFPLC